MCNSKTRRVQSGLLDVGFRNQLFFEFNFLRRFTIHNLTFYYALITGFFYTFVAVSSIIVSANYAVKYGWFSGFISGLGNVMVQLVWVIIAAFCMLPGSGFLTTYSTVFSVFGIIILFFFAYKIYTSPLDLKAQDSDKGSFFKGFIFNLGLSFGVPIRILGYAAIFMGFGIHTTVSLDSMFPLVAGVVLGTALWWLVFSWIVGLARNKITENAFRWCNRVGAVFLACVGVFSAISLFVIK